MVSDKIEVWTVKDSERPNWPKSLYYLTFYDGKPIVSGSTLGDALKPIVTGEAKPSQVLDFDPDDTDKFPDKFQEVNLDRQVPSNRVEKWAGDIGFKHDNGCGRVLLDTETVIRNVMKGASLTVAVGLMGEITEMRRVPDAINSIQTTASLRKSVIVTWSEDMTIINGELCCCHCGDEIMA